MLKTHFPVQISMNDFCCSFEQFFVCLFLIGLLALIYFVQAQNIRTLTNESVMKGVSLKAIVDPSNLIALIMNDLE